VRERRKNFRVEWNSPAKIYDCNGRFAALCVLWNFSNGGAKITGVNPDNVPDEFVLRISPHSRPHICRVIRRSKDGLEFADDKTTSKSVVSRRRKALCS
jgi:hypothetical protein